VAHRILSRESNEDEKGVNDLELRPIKSGNEYFYLVVNVYENPSRPGGPKKSQKNISLVFPDQFIFQKKSVRKLTAHFFCQVIPIKEKQLSILRKRSRIRYLFIPKK